MLITPCSVSKLVTSSIVSDSVWAIEQCFEHTTEQLPTFVSQYPVSGAIIVNN